MLFTMASLSSRGASSSTTWARAGRADRQNASRSSKQNSGAAAGLRPERPEATTAPGTTPTAPRPEAQSMGGVATADIFMTLFLIPR